MFIFYVFPTRASIYERLERFLGTILRRLWCDVSSIPRSRLHNVFEAKLIGVVSSYPVITRL